MIGSRRIVWALAIVVMALTVFTARVVDRQGFELTLVNATIVDGTGRPASRGDIAVEDGRIVRIGPAGSLQGVRRIDVTGLVVAPGFIDVHTHADDLAEHPGAAHFVRMGVTTVVAGNCGSSALDVGKAFAAIEAASPAVNFATLIGHNTVRRAVMGSDARPPSAEELERMKALIVDAMDAGAVGFSSGLQYTPGMYADRAELIELAREAGQRGGVYATHMRNEGTRLEEAVVEAIAVAQATRMPLQISHLKVDSPSKWGASTTALRLIDEANARGVRASADQYAYTAGSSSLSIRFPSWAREGSEDEVRARLRDGPTWARVKKEMAALVEERGFTDLSWATVASYPRDASLNGLTMKEVAQRLHGSDSASAQFDAARDLMIGGGASMVYHFMSEEDIERIMRHPRVSAASDAGLISAGRGVPHPRGYGNTARVLAHYVRGRQVLTLEDAVHKMTLLPAEQLGLAGRGAILEGRPADLVVFDPARIRDTATYDRPHAFPEGIVHVLVNGTFAVRDGQPTAERSGRILRLKK